ncbi:uncharacterized protein IL334_007925 [Kwoniella shivajii]|uniref:Peptidase S8/S53 domain-containing protein n=1 Tax=Kwoniella shivajii TaxID=564305 RepID=A0ABZ1DD48_9TREE|nr:hypothetical protein IL334_007925 [Kwoniella shivajii]
MSAISINSVSIDPNGEKRSTDAVNTDFIYIQSTAPLSREQKAGLAEDHNVQILELVEPKLYLCKYEGSSLDGIRALPFVNVANCYHNVFKTSPMVANTINSLAEDTKEPLNLILHRGVNDTESIVAKVRATDGVDLESLEVSANVVSVKASKQAMEVLKRIDGVRTVGPQIPQSIGNNVATLDIHATTFTHTDKLFSGKGQIILINDTGFDKGIKSDIHPAFANRIAALGVVGSGTHTPFDANGHGTHVAGSVAGLGQSDTMGNTICGSAPGSTLVIQSMIDAKGSFGPPNDYEKILKPSYENDSVRISNNSWGQNWDAMGYQVPYLQNTYADTLDTFVWAHPEMVVCVAAGNAGRSANGPHISGAAAAKNGITVGATFSSRPIDPAKFKYDPASVVVSDLTTAAAFSSKGPTYEQRVKPDVAAPGVAILSTASRHDDFLKKTHTDFGDSTDPLYFFLSGTSQATPLVTGCCAVIREMLLANGQGEPSAAAIKACLINGALSHGETHTDGSNATVQPDGLIGWGRVDLDHAIKIPGKTYEDDVADEQQGLQEGKSWDITLPNASGRKNLKVTLVWTDPPGALIQNPLGLTVFDDTVPQSPILLGSGFGTANQRPENNVQQVILHDLKANQHIRMHIAADWDFAIAVSQPYALAWSLFD